MARNRPRGRILKVLSDQRRLHYSPYSRTWYVFLWVAISGAIAGVFGLLGILTDMGGLFLFAAIFGCVAGVFGLVGFVSHHLSRKP